MVRNDYGAKYIWYEMVSGYGTKLQFCGTKLLWCKIAILWYEIMVNYGTKWFLVMVQNCNFVVRNGKLWYEMAMVRNGYGTK